VRLEVPDVLKREHRALLLKVQTAMPLPGRFGEAARRLTALLHAHLAREEHFAFPLLSLLPRLVNGNVGEEMAMALPVAERFRRELQRLREDHVEIVAALEEFGEAARAEGRDDYASLGMELIEHARVEESILYPAALMVGEYVRLSLRSRPEAVASPSLQD